VADVGRHVAGEQDATLHEEDRSAADGMRLMLDDLARVDGRRAQSSKRRIIGVNASARRSDCVRVSPLLAVNRSAS
jgi:hypothetical protein